MVERHKNIITQPQSNMTFEKWGKTLYSIKKEWWSKLKAKFCSRRQRNTNGTDTYVGFSVPIYVQHRFAKMALRTWVLTSSWSWWTKASVIPVKDPWKDGHELARREYSRAGQVWAGPVCFSPWPNGEVMTTIPLHVFWIVKLWENHKVNWASVVKIFQIAIASRMPE